jgi:nickel/cobalt exporter
MVRSSRHLVLVLALLALTVTLLAVAGPAWAQARNPFSVGISEGGGPATGLTGWILAQQAAFERLLAVTLRATKTDWRAGWTLVTLSFAYGVFHAAGPGHGKAVVTSYLIANERAFRRGLAISLLAALLQGAVAIAIVGIIAAILQQTATQMRWTAQLVETASYAGVALLGAWLVWRKGRAFVALLRPAPSLFQPAMAGGGALASATSSSRFVCEPCDDASSNHVHGPDCGHVHMPDPTRLGGKQFSLSEAAVTVFAAGIRPCSGAILVLVFALSQGLFWVGVGATLAMSLGTAITTGGLAALAVFAKTLALRLTGEASRRGLLLARACELAAALLVLALGVLLLIGYVQLS